MADTPGNRGKRHAAFKPLPPHHAERLEAIARVTGAIAHDFNNLIMVINGYADLVLARTPADDPRYPDLQEVKRATGRAADLTAQLLAAGKRNQGRPESFDLNEFLEAEAPSIVQELGPVSLNLRLSRSQLPIRMDRGCLRAALRELARNAHDAMPGGGEVVVETAATRAGDVLLTFRDNGPGVAFEDQPRLFEPFYTTRPRRVAKGLGLAILYGVVTQAGGQVGIESAPGQGTAIRIRWPR